MKRKLSPLILAVALAAGFGFGFTAAPAAEAAKSGPCFIYCCGSTCVHCCVGEPCDRTCG